MPGAMTVCAVTTIPGGTHARAWLVLAIGTVAAVAIGGTSATTELVSFSAAHTVPSSPWLNAAVRRSHEVFRSVLEIVSARTFVWAYGVGAIAGILEIATVPLARLAPSPLAY